MECRCQYANHNNDNNKNLRFRRETIMSDSLLVIPKRIWKHQQQQRDFRREMSESMVDVIALTTRGCCSDLKKGLAIAELGEERKDDVSSNNVLRKPEKQQQPPAAIAAIATANKRKADDEWHNNDGSSYYYDDQKYEHKKNGIVSPSNKKRIES
ncbi:hypothetical protein FRACYDRAFT_250083 [Fragilariopsis cylindrus CCMP1102]|uniref:Uncharacterized protein n=1 Tax=Fragilariopsis cylindrus CCMP1102 TaxID=635003 RepID=A0A1E7ER42_9STRA|nr:hypothetical protein FRACYDRAFT_250083 [Fragilariopsis cylindrus CCMP1102]|eukprot:OEU08294.1 hypothetical protein FRACYDRAFT_250083 [Fragilariopsis cylindrus CCMP1102]